MEIKDLETLWKRAIKDVLDRNIEDGKLSILAKQTNDSIRRIDIYKNYRERAIQAVKEKQPFIHTSNPFVLAQRTDLSLRDRTYIIYLATYFGKSEKSGWTLFNRASFDGNRSLIRFDQIDRDPDRYFKYLSSFDFFEDCDFSNHRKYMAKKSTGKKVLFKSMRYIVENIDEYADLNAIEFHDLYLLARRIPSFGRLGAFDFSSSLVKCGFNVLEPKSMYAGQSTGPLQGLSLLLRLTKKKDSINHRIKLSDDLVDWFNTNSKVFMVGQVLEDAICNWQKNTADYIRYKG